LAELLIALLDLAEAEGRSVRRGVVRLGMGLALLTAAAVLLVTGFVLLIWSVYLFLRFLFDPPGATLMTGIIAFVLAGGLLWGARRVSR
jgi:hypothetical protein